MAYIFRHPQGDDQSLPDHISLERYVVESSYVTKYLSRIVKDKALVVYNVLFHLSWFETGKGQIVIPWRRVGEFIRSEQGNIIDDNTTVKRRVPPLIEYKCITVNRKRGAQTRFPFICRRIYLPVGSHIDQEERERAIDVQEKDVRDYYNDTGR